MPGAWCLVPGRATAVPNEANVREGRKSVKVPDGGVELMMRRSLPLQSASSARWSICFLSFFPPGDDESISPRNVKKTSMQHPVRKEGCEDLPGFGFWNGSFGPCLKGMEIEVLLQRWIGGNFGKGVSRTTYASSGE